MLNREPDKSAVDDWSGRRGGDERFRDLLIRILNSPEFALKWKDVILQRAGADPPAFFKEQSQYGEVGRLLRHMVNTAAAERIVVDVGANGRERSNSYDLMKYFDWKGILIEANPERIPIIESEFQGLDYSLFNCAVSDYSGEATFHLGVNDDISSLELEATKAWGPLRRAIRVRVRPLHEVLAEQQVPREFGLLSVDAEGEDIRIINDTISHGYRPNWIIMEVIHDHAAPSLAGLGLTDSLLSSYELIDSTVANLILRRLK
jgi:FkbM family methyltransferase